MAMARRGRRSNNTGAAVVLAVVLLASAVVTAVKDHPGASIAVVALLVSTVAYVWYRRRVRRAREEAAAVAAIEEERRWWRELSLPEGRYTVTLTSVKKADDARLFGFLFNLALNPAVDLPDAEVMLERAEHIGPQRVVSGVDEDVAVTLKKALEDRGARAKITEGTTRSREDGRREPIPERVRHEVWRRDDGQCVDCGSRERLEFDHIVPWSKGGSNTARNLELRCETCNRKKAAKI